MKTQLLLATFGWGDFLSILDSYLWLGWVVGFIALAILALKVPGLIDVLKEKKVYFCPASNGDIYLRTIGKRITDALLTFSDKEGVHGANDVGEIEITKNKKQSFWVKQFGVYFLPWYHIRNQRILEYPFHWTKMYDEGNQPAGLPIIKQNIVEGKVLVARSETVSSIRYVWTYPVYTGDLEVQGNFKISILTNVTVRILKPIEIISLFKGEWYSILENEVIGRIAEYVRNKDIDTFRQSNKTDPGLKDGFVETIKEHTYLGGRVKIIDVAYVGFDYSNNPPDVIAALMESEKVQKLYNAKLEEVKRGKELEELRAGAADITREVGLKDAKAKADASAYTARQQLEALRTHPDGSEIERARLLADAIGKHTGSLVLGANVLSTLDVTQDSGPKIITNPREGGTKR